MSREGCPEFELTCDECVAEFVDDHPGLDVWEHTYHICECPMVACDADNHECCVGCGEPRDLFRECMASYPERVEA